MVTLHALQTLHPIFCAWTIIEYIYDYISCIWTWPINYGFKLCLSSMIFLSRHELLPPLTGHPDLVTLLVALLILWLVASDDEATKPILH